jgi:hypothetical protein
MLEICFFLFLVVLFYGAGRAFLDLIRWESDYLAFTLGSCTGVVVVTIAVTWFYKLGGSLNRFFWIISIIVGGFLFWKLMTRGRSLFLRISGARLEFLAMAGFAACIILPALSGGEQFTFFRGNHHDSFNYLEAAITYRKLSYSHVSQLDIVQLVHLGLFKFGQDNLHYRPEITFLYASLSSFHSEAFLRLHYVLLVYFQFLSFCTVRALVVELLPGRRIIQLLLATALVGGFWGQYILDIDAWSQISCMPLIVFSLLLLIKLTQTIRSPEETHSVDKPLLLYALVWVGLFYLYPEAAGFLLPAHAICWAIAAGLFKLRVNWSTAGLATLAACILLLPIFDSNLLFLLGQGSGSLARYDWWTYFQAFLFGRDDVNPDLFSNVADFVAGAGGIYFLTPDPIANAAVAFATRALILVSAFVFIFRLARDFRALLLPPWLLLTSHVVISLLITLGFCLLQQYWTAGKAFSFTAYLALLLLVGSVFCRGSSGRSWLDRLALTAASVFLLLQLSFFFYRPFAAHKPFGIHYPPPYPALATLELKTTINFADWSILRHLHVNDNVAVHIEDPFIQSFVRMLLLSHHVRFCLEPPAFDRSSRSSVIPTGICPKATVRLVVIKSSKGPFSFHLALIPPVATP